MKRQLTTREWLLLGVLGIMLLVSAYILLFYNPMTAARDRYISETETCRAEIEAARQRIEEKRRMERELEELFASDPPPLGIPDYDNLKPVMFELNSILANARDYSLSFSTVDESQTIIRRSIAMSFSTDTYRAARTILQQLHDSGYRCMMDNVNISFTGGTTNGFWQEYVERGVSVSATIVFFEYHDNSKTVPEAAPEAAIEAALAAL